MKLSIFFIISIFLLGCTQNSSSHLFGLKESDACNSIDSTKNPESYAKCLHEAAITNIFKCPSQENESKTDNCPKYFDDAKFACSKIYSEADGRDSDIYITKANDCYYDVAKYSGDVSICNEIKSSTDDLLSGSSTSSKFCVSTASKTAEYKNKIKGGKACGFLPFVMFAIPFLFLRVHKF